MAGFTLATLSTVATVVGAGTAVYGTIKSAGAQARGEALQRSQIAEQRRAQAAQERASRRAAIRRNQITQAQAISTAQSAGGLTGSAAAGGINSLSSRLGTDLGFGSMMSGINQNITNLGGQISQANYQAQAGQTLAGLGGTAFSLGARFGGLDFLNRGQTPTLSVPDFTS